MRILKNFIYFLRIFKYQDLENAKKGKVDSVEEPREANDIFRELNEKRKMSARPGSAAAGTGKLREPRACAERALLRSGDIRQQGSGGRVQPWRPHYYNGRGLRKSFNHLLVIPTIYEYLDLEDNLFWESELQPRAGLGPHRSRLPRPRAAPRLRSQGNQRSDQGVPDGGAGLYPQIFAPVPGYVKKVSWTGNFRNFFIILILIKELTKQ